MLLSLFLCCFNVQKVEIVRKSYRTQLANAIQKIAGEYKVGPSLTKHGPRYIQDLEISLVYAIVAWYRQQLCLFSAYITLNFYSSFVIA